MGVQQFGGVTLKVGGIVFAGMPKEGIRVINKTGSAIAKDKLVAVTTLDVTSKRPKIVLADADVAGHDNVYVTTYSIANGAEGVVSRGAVSAANLNTNSITTVGDAVFLDTTAGGFSVTAPATAGARVQPVGYVVVKSATIGQIMWNVGPIRKFSASEVNGAIGYTSGGAAVTQATNKTTGVTLSALSGTITMAAGSITAEQAADFIVTNTFVAIGDVIVLSIQSGSNGGNTSVSVAIVTAGTFTIRVSNNNVAAGTAETGVILINLAVIKAVSA